MKRLGLSRMIVFAVVFGFALALSGCAVGPDFHSPAGPSAQGYTRGILPPTTAVTASSSGSAGSAQHFVAAETMPGAWWTRFQSDELNRLVDEALRHSPTLDAARARLLEAKESYRSQAGQTWLPSVDASVSATRKQVDLASFGIANAQNPGPFTLYDASVSVSYALDIFGGNRRSLEATRAEVDYAAFELDAARLTLAANVVSAAIRRASLQQQLALTQDLEAAQAQQLAMMERRLAAGGIAELDVHAQRTLLAQTHATLSPLTVQLAQTEHRLAVLLGSSPAEAQLGELPLDSLTLPQTLPLTLPSTLARERPDIRASEAVLHQASAKIGVATANLYPKFVISASAGSERTHVEDIVKSLNIWNVGLGLTQPIFHGGALRAQRRAALAAYDAAFADYRQTVLQALQQVADALRAVQSDADALRAQDAAFVEAQTNLRIDTARYTAGGISQFAVVDANRQVLQTKLARAKAQADRLSDTAALFQSLGGAPLQ
ncbi:efflux transporter outer membrane subunit [Trinickia sp. LjRoot230]|uniref:efflux transporter outer membrane subunit n=1 Tax=Trinickia sp. LjRoot230 TaxID=3342288 RepID=UPI003F502ECB